MEATVLSLQNVLSERRRWCVPVYQRHYAWDTGDDSQLSRLWEDILGKAEDVLAGRPSYPHYIGALLVAEPPAQPFGQVRQMLLVDGQQRMTTFQLVLAAIREVGRQVELPEFDAAIAECLFNQIGGGMANPEAERFKLWPSRFDRDLFKNIVTLGSVELRRMYPDYFFGNGNLRVGAAPRLLAAFWYLMLQARNFIDEGTDSVDRRRRMDAFLRGFLQHFRMVIIQLDASDDAQEIFSSLNGLGKPLSPFDLIRNDVFHRARQAQENDEHLFETHWAVFEEQFWEAEARQGRYKRSRIDFFIAHLLVAETGQDVNLGKLAVTYQAYSRGQQFPTVADELKRLSLHVPTYKALLLKEGNHPAVDIGLFFAAWDQTTFYPLVFHVCAQSISTEDKRAILDRLKAYVIRRDLVGGTSKNYNKIVVQLISRIRGQPLSVDSFVAALKELQGEAGRLPLDRDVLEALPSMRIYKDLAATRLKYLLHAIEQRLRSARDESVVLTDNLTIEHVMPQSWSGNWPLRDKTKAPCESAYLAAAVHGVDEGMRGQIAEREAIVDTIGNLTLLTSALNPALGNAGWLVKKAELGRTLLAMTREIANTDDWNEDAVRTRSAKLATLACEIWPI